MEVMQASLWILLALLSVLGDTVVVKRRERDYPAQRSQTVGVDEEIDSLRDKLYSPTSRRLLANTEEILSWIRMASVLQMKDTMQNTGGGILQGEAVDALTEALSIVDRMMVPGGSIEGATDQKKKELLSSKFHAHHIRGVLHRSMGNPALAVADHDACLQLGGNNEVKALAYFNKGNALMGLKKESGTSLVDAIDSFETALTLKPDYAEVYPILVECQKAHKKYNVNEWKALVGRMEKVMGTLEAAPTEKRGSYIYFALYDAAEAAKDLGRAFKYLDKARAIEFASRGKASYVDDMVLTHYHLRSIFTREFFANPMLQHGTSGDGGGDGGAPVFIIGMMRSGSTLMETSLDLHPDIQGIGEYSIFNANLNTFRHELVAALGIGESGGGDAGGTSPLQVLQKYAEDVWGSMKDSAARLHSPSSASGDEDGSGHTHDSSAQAPRRVLDKMLFNYKNVGFIHLVYPRAVVLHMVRDPMDNLFSAYRKKFDDDGMEWTLSAEQLVATYAEYLRVMQHFRQVLPGRVIDVPFEVLVNHPKAVLRDIVSKLGVPWDDKVLNLQSSSRVILTHSRMQMSAGIHNSSVGAWTKYRDQLRPLVLELRKHLPALRREGALPFVKHYNWGLDANFDYPACVREMAGSLGYLARDGDADDGDDGATRPGHKQEQGPWDDVKGGVVAEGMPAADKEAARRAASPESSPIFAWHAVQGSVAATKVDDAEWDALMQAVLESDSATVSTSTERSKGKGENWKAPTSRKSDGGSAESAVSPDGTSSPPSPTPTDLGASSLPNTLYLCPGEASSLLSALAANPLLADQGTLLQGLPLDRALGTCYAAAVQELSKPPPEQSGAYADAESIKPSDIRAGQVFAALSLFVDTQFDSSGALLERRDCGAGSGGNSDGVYLSLSLSELLRAGATAGAFAGKYAEAEAMLSVIVSHNPEDVDALDRLVEVGSMLGRAEGMLEAISQAIEVELRRGRPVGHRVLRGCKVLLAQGAVEAAYGKLKELREKTEKGDLRFAVRSPVDQASLLKAIGKCEHEFGHLETAVGLYTEVLRLVEAHQAPAQKAQLGQGPVQEMRAIGAEAIYDRSVSLMTWGRHAEAERGLDKCLSLGLEVKVVYGFRGLLRQNLGRCGDAQRDIDKVLTAFDPTDSTALLLSAVCFENTGDYPRALTRYNQMLLLHPSSSATERREVVIRKMLALHGQERGESLPAAVKRRLAYGFDSAEPRGKGDSEPEPPADGEMPSAEAVRAGLLSTDYQLLPSVDPAQMVLSPLMGGGDTAADPADEGRTEALLSVLNKTWHLPLFVQSKEPGFLPHKTHHRQFQLAIPHMAQALVRLADSHNDGGSGQDRDWRAFFEVGRAWRGASEAMDAVYWVDELGLKETLKERAGMNTFLQLGRNEVARYYPQMDKAVAATKKWLLRRGYYGDEDELVPVPTGSETARLVQSARSLEELHRAIGRNFLVVTQVETTSEVSSDAAGAGAGAGAGAAAKAMDGVVFALIKSKQEGNPGWDFSVNAGSTASRFAEFSQQMERSFRRVVETIRAARSGQQEQEQAVLEAALELFYYWANFGALTRGTSAVGHVVVSAVLLAAGYDVSKSLPEGLQLDWEAFYAASPQEFAHATARYLSLTPCRHSTSEIPAVSDLIVSTTDMHRALLATSTSSSDLLVRRCRRLHPCS